MKEGYTTSAISVVVYSIVTGLDYIKIEKFKEEYKELLNIDPNDTRCMLYSADQQIERYAQNIAFWLLRKPHMREEDFEYAWHVDKATLVYVTNRLKTMCYRVDDMFFYDEESKTMLFNRVIELMLIHG